MKLASSSTAFDEMLRGGELTQLEWIDFCAHELTADGAVFDLRHFPRTDTDYLAQVKKMAADLGLTVAALRHDGFFGGDDTHMTQSLEIALAIGAPLLCAPLPPETAISWPDLSQRIGSATSLAKRFNVTLALRNRPGTYAASTHDLKRVSKEADSAWLRYGPEFGALEAGSDAAALTGKAVLAWAQSSQDDDQVREWAGLLTGFCGFVALDDDAGSATPAQTKNAFRLWREAFFIADRT